jgi:GNAT superfamily N-acetyltransferase
LAATVYAQVKSMIGNQLCAGVRNVEDGVLVSWCLTYPDGSMGVLYTHQVRLCRTLLLYCPLISEPPCIYVKQDHRGKGLARIAVIKAMEKCAAKHAVEPRPVEPYVYIAHSNLPSQKLFTGVGFELRHDVVWAELTLKDNA